jgi:hypothetical protein
MSDVNTKCAPRDAKVVSLDEDDEIETGQRNLA